MNKQARSRVFFWIAAMMLAYMPLHVLVVQSASLLSGGIGIWKAAKDVFIVLLTPILLYIGHRRGFLKRRFLALFILASIYILLHLLFVLFDKNDDTYSAIVGSVYNSRLLAYLLLGVVLGSVARNTDYLKKLLTVVVLVSTVVASFGVAQYFLPKNMLEHVGYSVERGVKPMFYIDDKPDLPRVMSTLRDPNSLGAYLLVPLLVTLFALVSQKANRALHWRPFRREVLALMAVIQAGALVLTFSRGALIATFLSVVTILSIVYGKGTKGTVAVLRKHRYVLLAGFVLVVTVAIFAHDSYLFKNVIFHADESTVLADPNELRVELFQKNTTAIIENPRGYGPGTAGLVSISNPQGGVLTENYYLQIAYEVGWLGLGLFIVLYVILMRKLALNALRGDLVAQILFSAGVGYAFYSLLIHLWSNEAVALQWWLLAGMSIAQSTTRLSVSKNGLQTSQAQEQKKPVARLRRT